MMPFKLSPKSVYSIGLLLIFIAAFATTGEKSFATAADTKVDLDSSLLQNQPCIDGLSAQSFPCLNVNLFSRLDLKTSGIPARSTNDIWGWTDSNSGREFALVGLNSKMSVVEVTDPANPIHWGDLKTQTYSSTWRDVKVYQNHAFIVSEAYNHGLQILDLRPILTLDRSSAPYEFSNSAFYDMFGSAHNIAINEDSGYAYVVGTDTCDAGMHVVDIRQPLHPTFATCVDKAIFEPVREISESPIRILHGEDYTHDVQCVNYHGPDEAFQGKELCFCSNADTVNIVDVTNKANPVQVSVKGYNGIGYTHQGWLTEDHKYFLLGDELDEMEAGHNTRTLIWDVSKISAPSHIGDYFSSQKAIDHNLYVKGNFAYQSNYDAGLRILDISDIANANLKEVGFFDTEPTSNVAEFLGAWSVYPYFPSGNVILSNISGHLFSFQDVSR